MTVGLVRGARNLRRAWWVVVQADLTVGGKADGGGKKSRSDVSLPFASSSTGPFHDMIANALRFIHYFLIKQNGWHNCLFARVARTSNVGWRFQNVTRVYLRYTDANNARFCD